MYTYTTTCSCHLQRLHKLFCFYSVKFIIQRKIYHNNTYYLLPKTIIITKS
jgi:hypothetical protein